MNSIPSDTAPIHDPVLYALTIEQKYGVNLDEMIYCLDEEIAYRCATARALIDIGDRFDIKAHARKSHVLEGAMKLLEKIRDDDELKRMIINHMRRRKATQTTAPAKPAQPSGKPLEIPF